MAEIPVIQILDKAQYATQALVSLPNALPLPPLADSSIRVRTEVFSLTMNNLSYARLGDFLNWWDVHPLPEATPAPYNDATKYGRTNCWGYARVLESTSATVPAGSYIFGYLPLGTLPQDLLVAPAHPSLPHHITVLNPHRQHILVIYNRYQVALPSAPLAAQIAAGRSTPVALDALLIVMHLTAYVLAEYAFPADTARAVHPSQHGKAPWSAADADLAGATVLVFAPGSKAALCFAWMLRQRRGRGAGEPRRVVGVASRLSAAYARGTGLYDEVLASEEKPGDLMPRLGAGAGDKVAVFEFGGRGAAAAAWTAALQEARERVQFVSLGSAQPRGEDLAKEKMQGPPPTHVGRVPIVFANADDLRLSGIAKDGEAQFYKGMDESWAKLREEGFKGFRVTWGEGMEDVKKGWDRLNRGDLGPEEGLVFKV
ncbi:hypothetical protein F4810DRAFT_589456 [Camillea tinctor]|nr:hypothetical protein F4810DRAFT_589456 [Camillea tinctor]